MKVAQLEQEEGLEILPEIIDLIMETDNLYSLFTEAEGLMFEGREDEALAKYSKIVEKNYDSLYGHLSAGQIAVLRGKGELDTALNEFLEAKNCEKRLLSQRIITELEDRVGINLGLTYRKLKQFEEAVAAFKSVNPPLRAHKNAFAYAGLSSVYRGQAGDKPEESEALLLLAEKFGLQALEVDENLSYAKTGLAKIYSTQGAKDSTKLELARQIAEEVIDNEPENWYLLGLLANLYEKADKTKAEEYYRRACCFAPKRENYARIGYARLLKNKPKPELAEAEKMLMEVLAVEPYNTTALADLADILRNLNRFGEAKTAANSALELLKDRPERQTYVRVTLARIEIELGNIQAAKATIAPADARMREEIAKKGGYPDSKINSVLKRILTEQARAAEIYQQAQDMDAAGNTDEAIKALYSVIDRNPRHAGFKPYWILAEMLIEKKQYREAAEVSQLALKNGEKFGYSELAIARAYYNVGREEDALLMIRKALIKNGASVARFEPNLAAKVRDISVELEGRWGRVAGKKRLNLASSQGFIDDSPHFVFTNSMTGREEWHSSEKIRQFLEYVLRTQNLPMGQLDEQSGYIPIEKMGDQPVFLVAKTGVGKTVSVPTKILISHMQNYFRKNGINGRVRLKDKYPQIFVVVPRIPIAQSQMNFMNFQYQEFLKTSGVRDVRNCNLFGSISSVGKRNDKAPILFVTTGIFESMTFNGQLDPDLHRVIIDEAHVTIEQNPGVEMGIGMADAAKVAIDYMSATVETSTLKDDLKTAIVTAGKDRYPILLQNLGGTVEENLLEVIEKFLIDSKEEYYPDRSHEKYGQITVDLFDKRHARPRGLLVIVNSHQGATSDTLRFCKMIEQASFNQKGERLVSAFSYAAPVARNKAAEDRFRRQIEAVEKRNGLYVIIATNVVEMGVTFDSLDYMITMDSEFATLFVDGGQLIEAVPLGINALYQRIGRVGRKRGGIAFIAKEIGADYTKLSDEELQKGLPCQRINFPIAKGNVQKLALYSYKQGWPDPLQDLAKLTLPSLRTEKDAVEQKFLLERKKIANMGLTDENRLNQIGERSLGYLTVENLDYKRLLALAEAKGQDDLVKVIMVAAAAADVSMGQFLISGTKFISDDDGTKESLRIDRYLSVNEQADPELVRELVAKYRGETLASALISEAHFSASNANLILHYLDDDYLLSKIEAENEVQEGTESEMVETGLGLYFSKNSILSDPDCEAITIYRIIAYLYNRFVIRKRASGISKSRAAQIDELMGKEILELGLNPMIVRTVIKNFEDLTRQIQKNSAGRRASGSGPRVLGESDRQVCFESALLEKAAALKLDFSLEMIEEMTQELLSFDGSLKAREDQSAVKQILADLLEKYGYATVPQDVEAILRNLVTPAYNQLMEVLSTWEEKPELTRLPLMTEGLRRKAIDFIVQNDFGQEFVLTFHGKEKQKEEQVEGKSPKENVYYMTWVGKALSENGKTLDVLVRPLNTCLQLPLSENRPIKVRGRLIPAYFTEMESEKDVFARGGKQLASFLRKKQRVFELLHITIVE